jgi:hypothetical protein
MKYLFYIRSHKSNELLKNYNNIIFPEKIFLRSKKKCIFGPYIE